MTRLTFEDYADKAGVTAIYPGRGNNVIYPVLGLTGESGEVAEKVKKLLRDKGGVIDDEFREAVKKELGDVLWYLAAMAYELGFTLTDVAWSNLEKVERRNTNGTVHGDGDDR